MQKVIRFEAPLRVCTSESCCQKEKGVWTAPRYRTLHKGKQNPLGEAACTTTHPSARCLIHAERPARSIFWRMKEEQTKHSLSVPLFICLHFPVSFSAFSIVSFPIRFHRELLQNRIPHLDSGLRMGQAKRVHIAFKWESKWLNSVSFSASTFVSRFLYLVSTFPSMTLSYIYIRPWLMSGIS